ncbi:hypothetical protein VPNG_04248 [Cytospora leucostoma]|uniref:RING-type domain-containing protein n=1 Tax=Cytospora leucostoma TaxID=1230097 RepID=A0A423XDT7_9PEZI|nr:hypothetical protein VPNG_04248 [Cytospora leucostoma]
MTGNTYVDDIQNAVLLFSNPVWSGSDSIPSTVIRNITALSSDIAYSAEINDNITILSSKYAPTSNGIIQGLMYVPDLDSDDPCRELESAYVPSTAVRQSDLPPSDYNLIALVPWYNGSCTKSYLSAAAVDPIRAYITYKPDNTSGKPPDVNNEQWNLHDSGAWKTDSKFPIYAVSGLIGSSMMKQLSLYSGNVSSVPYGQNITALYSPDADDYVRIWSQIHVSTANTLPTLWIFILVCVAVLLVVVVAISLFIHYVHRKRRASLRRRVVSGEVNLEAMNIKRVTVPIEHIEKFPLFTYNYEPKSNISSTFPNLPRGAAQSHVRNDSLGIDETISSNSAPAVWEKAMASPAVISHLACLTAVSTATDYQPTCMICSESFRHRVTIIRELPCGHIYHPHCIDEYLSEQSSLCPQCKALLLPRGYSPKITNAMVRRERAIRRLRSRVIVEDSDAESAVVTSN